MSLLWSTTVVKESSVATLAGCYTWIQWMNKILLNSYAFSWLVIKPISSEILLSEMIEEMTEKTVLLLFWRTWILFTGWAFKCFLRVFPPVCMVKQTLETQHVTFVLIWYDLMWRSKRLITETNWNHFNDPEILLWRCVNIRFINLVITALIFAMICLGRIMVNAAYVMEKRG